MHLSCWAGKLPYIERCKTLLEILGGMWDKELSAPAARLGHNRSHALTLR